MSKTFKYRFAYLVTPDGKRLQFSYTKRPVIGETMGGFVIAKINGENFFLELPPRDEFSTSSQDVS